jgi:hypothetical protein
MTEDDPGTPAAQVARDLAALFGANAPEQVGVSVFDGIVQDVGTADDTERARRLTRRMVASQHFMEWLSSYRDEAVRGMRSSGASLDDIARALEISKSRAQQLVRRLERGPQESGPTVGAEGIEPPTTRL